LYAIIFVKILPDGSAQIIFKILVIFFNVGWYLHFIYTLLSAIFMDGFARYRYQFFVGAWYNVIVNLFSGR